MTKWTVALALGLAGCPKPPPPAVEDAGPRYADFAVRITTPEQSVTAAGTLVVAPPDKFRLEVRGPLGGPQLIVASDGAGLWAWQAAKNTFYEAPDADARLGEEGLGMETVAALLLGRLPEGLGEPVKEGEVSTWTRDGVTVRATEEAGALRWFEAKDADGKVWVEMSANVADDVREYRLPTVGTEVRLDLEPWSAAQPDPSLFTLTAPEGAERKPIALPAGKGP